MQIHYCLTKKTAFGKAYEHTSSEIDRCRNAIKIMGNPWFHAIVSYKFAVLANTQKKIKLKIILHLSDICQIVRNIIMRMHRIIYTTSSDDKSLSKIIVIYVSSSFDYKDCNHE